MIAILRAGYKIRFQDGSVSTIVGSRSFRGKYLYALKDAFGKITYANRADILAGQKDGSLTILDANRPLKNPAAIGKIVTVSEWPKIALDMGKVSELIYQSSRDGNFYRHVFKKDSRPLLAVSDDGKQLILIGGSYRVTERGIVDD